MRIYACLCVCVRVSDNDTCIDHQCVNGATCKQIIGGYTCGPCPEGFAGLYCQRGPRIIRPTLFQRSAYLTTFSVISFTLVRLITVVLWNTADHYIFILWFLSIYLLLSFFLA